ncbi:DHA2 family efflux MFS transporter permease subunit [Paenibacillus sp. GCM10023248]|uniref:DHA2 family efflux MFS transporter permease subunit n=1 Tax=Bacillales TaxID=1385 RepID=UPI00237862D0|nr:MULTISPECIES: DHA2 family efflux MFS transporter permease subunit [Bacillales]MDD9270689.1 DHA2 family efflux MFS transporter permease subunit [Paenibacillus sp. MAHUQ-63]MDR6883402.1 EmrB/QacA subfamily drug resistance transporter [Bacillus sp. 3255]
MKVSKDDLQQVRFWPIMIAIFFGSFVSILSMSTINIAIPILSEHFHSDLSKIQWTITGFMLASGTIAPITGYLGERFSYKRLYALALVGFTVFSLLCAIAWDAPSLIAFRIIQGAFSGLIMPATMTIVYQVIPREKQPIAISLWSLSAMMAPAIGPTLSGWLLQNWSWHWLFLLNVPVGLIATYLVIRLIPFYRLSVPKRFDAIGLITVVIGSLTLLVAFSEGHAWGWTSGRIIGLFATGVVVLGLFIWRELRAETPLLNVRVLTNARFSLTLIISSIVTISLYSGTFLTPIFLQNIQHVTPLDTGLILLPASLAMALCMPLVGKLYSVVGPRILIFVGIALIAVGTLTLSWLSVDVSRGYILFWMIVRNVGIAFATMPASNAGMEQIPRTLSGHATSMSNWVRNVFGSFAIALFTSVLAAQSTKHATDLAAGGIQDKAVIGMQSFTMSVNDVYLLATFIVLVALPLSLFVGKRSAEKEASAPAAVAVKAEIAK